MKQLFTLLLCAVVFTSCSSSAGKSSYADSLADSTLESDSLPPDTEQDAAAKPAEKTEKWEYSEEEDKMTSKKKYFANIVSDNELNFEFPYNGGSFGGVMVRKMNGKSEVILSISKGQFNTNSDGTYVKVRFDKNKPLTFAVNEPSDGSSTFLFVQNSKKFLTQLKNAKKMIVQAEFYQSGLREMEFTTAGFKWEH